MRKPRLFLLDEPLSNLDAKLRLETRVELRKLQRSLGVTTVYVTHDQEEAMTIADRMAMFMEGKIAQVGTPAEVFARPATTAVAAFIGSPPMNYCAHASKPHSYMWQAFGSPRRRAAARTAMSCSAYVRAH